MAALALAPLLGFRWSAHAAPPTNPIQTENSLPGDPNWNLFNPPASDAVLSGYGSKISVNRGEAIDFFVTTTAPSFSIDIYRTGWYGGAGARLVTSLGSFPGAQQPIPSPDAITGMIACNWVIATTLTVPTTWTTGVYLARLNGSDGNKSFILFVVRNDGGHEALVFETSVASYEAYNLWGGTSLSSNTTSGAVYPFAHATKVSFDRPFSPLDSQGAGDYLKWEYPFVRWMESKGYDVTYATDVDADTNISPLTNHQGLLSVGRDDYWSKGMRDNVQNAINTGLNVAFFSAGEIYWQIRFEQAGRVIVGYKDYAQRTSAPGPDPMFNVNNGVVTAAWADPIINLPSNATSGLVFAGANSGSYVVANASNWVYAGTGFTDGTVVPGLVGYEYDAVSNNGFSPAGLTILSQSPMGGSSTANSSIYTAPSGARVFAAGTVQWGAGLDPHGYGCSPSCVNPGIQQATANILDAFVAPRLHDLKVVVPASVTAGQPFNIAVTAEDAQGNPVPNYSGTVHFSSSDTSAAVVLPADSTLTNGQGTFSVTLTKAGTQTLTVSDAANSLSSNVTMTVVGVHDLKFVVPAAVTAGQAFNVTVTAEDAQGSPFPSYTGIVHFSSSDTSPGVVLSADSTLNNGQGTFSVTLTKAGVQTLTVSDAANSLSTAVTTAVAAARAASLSLSGYPTAAKCNVAFNVTVTLSDRFGNIATGYVGAVHFTSTDALAQLPTDYRFTGANAGTHALSVTLLTPTTPLTSTTITVTDIGDASLRATTAPIAVSAM